MLADAKQQGLAGPNVAELVNRVAVPHKDIATYAEAEDWHGPHPRAAGAAQVHRPRRVRPHQGRDVSAAAAPRPDAHRDLIAREFLATRFELAERPTQSKWVTA